ncbi:MAG: hypothetical protein ACREMW_14450, partial [Gemmatimonadales bacterium]
PTGLVVSCKWPDGVPADTTWWARIRGPKTFWWMATPKWKYKCAKRWDHKDLKDAAGNPIHIPGAVRWRWRANDETSWVRCDQGCCQPH